MSWWLRRLQSIRVCCFVLGWHQSCSGRGEEGKGNWRTWLQRSEPAECDVEGIWETRGKTEEPDMDVWESEAGLAHHQCPENQTSCSFLHCFVHPLDHNLCCGTQEHQKSIFKQWVTLVAILFSVWWLIHHGQCSLCFVLTEECLLVLTCWSMAPLEGECWCCL